MDPPEERLVPLLIALGQAVLAGAVMEKILLVDIARRKVQRDGFYEQLANELTRLETQPGGRLLQALKRLDLDEGQATVVADVIRRRNRLVHHFMEDPDVMAAMAGSGDVGPVIDRVEQLCVDIQTAIDVIGGPALGSFEEIYGMDLQSVARALVDADLNAVPDPQLRAKLAELRKLPITEFLADHEAEGD